MGIHASGGAIESLDGGGVGDVVPHLLQCLFDAWPTAMSFLHFDGFQLSSLSMLDDLDMSEAPGNAIVGIGRTSNPGLTGGR